jgi:1-acyl-sn-glycerol-3-phosphate acyltransferase
LFARLVYRGARLTFLILLKFFYNLSVVGRENIPGSGGFIIASNHVSNLDPVLIGVASARIINYMAKEALFKNRLFGSALLLVRAFPVKRGSADISAVKEAIKRLKEGGGLVIFPQGTRRQENSPNAQAGIGMLAYRTKVPVVPAFIAGSDRALPAGAKFFRPSKIRIILGKPLYFENKSSYPEIAHMVMREISALGASLKE